MKNYFLVIAFLLSAFNVFATDPDDIIGVWANGSNKGHIQIFKDRGKYYGKIIWLYQPNDKTGRPKVDHNNPNKDVRTKPLLGLIMLKDFKYVDEDEEWIGGRIYNPDDGKEYKAYMKLRDAKTLTVRGYIGFSWIGKTETFHRVR